MRKLRHRRSSLPKVTQLVTGILTYVVQLPVLWSPPERPACAAMCGEDVQVSGGWGGRSRASQERCHPSGCVQSDQAGVGGAVPAARAAWSLVGLATAWMHWVSLSVPLSLD